MLIYLPISLLSLISSQNLHDFLASSKIKNTPSGIRTRGPNRVKVVSEPTRPSEQSVKIPKKSECM